MRHALKRLLVAVTLLSPFVALGDLTPEAKIIPTLQPQAVQLFIGDRGTCSGVWISDEHIMSAKHCSRGAYTERYVIKDWDGHAYAAKLAFEGEGRGIQHDWAIFSVQGHRSSVWATPNCGPVQYGQSLIGIGNALGNTGLLVYLGKVHEPSYDANTSSGTDGYWKHAILTNLHGGPGVSGGPVWNLDGELVGLMVGALAPRDVGLIQEITYPTQYISILCGEHKD